MEPRRSLGWPITLGVVLISSIITLGVGWVLVSIAADETPEQDESPQAKEPPAGELPTTTAEKVAWCRQHDAQ